MPLVIAIECYPQSDAQNDIVLDVTSNFPSNCPQHPLPSSLLAGRIQANKELWQGKGAHVSEKYTSREIITILWYIYLLLSGH